MKRHISIFALLLSAFAAVGACGVVCAAEDIRAIYVSMGGSWNGNDQEHISPITVSLSSPRFESQVFTALPPVGYKVSKWLWNDSRDAAISENAMTERTAGVSADKKSCTVTYSSDGSRALGVRFDYITYKVKYDANGGSGAPADATGNSYNADFTLSSTVPTKPGYTFDKWKADTNGETYSAGATVAGSALCKSDWHEDGKVVTMTAQWTGSKYTVTVDRNGGTTDGNCPDYTTSTDQQMLTFTPPTWVDHVIASWDVTGYSGNKPTVDGNTLTIPANTYGNLTLKPTWKSGVRKLTVNPNGGKYEGQDFEQDVGKLRPGTTDLNAISVATRNYYSLVGYYLSSSGGTKVYDKDGHNVQCDNYWTADYPDGTFEGTSDLKVYAVWQANAVDVSFDKQGGSGGSDGTQATYQEALPQIVPPTRIGYEFGGYYTGKNGGGTKYYSSDGSSYQKWTSMGTTTLYANWTPHGFKIAYELDGGSTGTDAPNSPKVGTDFRVSSPHRTGWTFTGWNVIGAGVDYTTAKWGVSSGAASMSITDGSQVCFDPDRDYVYFLDLASGQDATVTLKANWTRTEYSLTVDPNGGTYRESTGSTTLNEKLFYGLTNLNDIGIATREGYDLRGYYTASNGGEAVYDEKGQGKNGSYWTANYPAGTYKKTENLRVYAQWTIATYAVNYAPGDFAKETATDSDTKEWGTDLKLRGSTYTRTGYTQDGWSRMSDGSTLDFTLGGNYTENAAVTLYPHWKANKYELTINPNGGVYDGKDFPDKLSEKLVYDGTDLNQILIATKADHSPLLGYWTATSGGTKVYDAQGRYVVGDYWTADGEFKGTANITAHAMWGEPKKYHDISVSADPETAGSVEGGGTYEEGSNAVLRATANTGYSFCCWTNGNEVVSTENPWTNEVTEAADYVAVFTGNVYRVTFDIGDYDGDTPRAIFVRFGSPYGTLPEPVYEEELRKFVCWRDEENGNVISAETIVQTPKKHTLVADSTLKQTYTIVYDGNGETSGTMEGQIAIRDEGTVLKSNGFNRTGYDFAGWTNTVVEAFYADGATVTNLAAAKETATLSAVWMPHTYTVKFNKNFNSSTHPDMNDQPFTYDEEKSLSPNQYLYPDEKYDFVGWATSELGNVVYEDEEIVSNLTAVAGDVVTLYAKWGFPGNELSVAADCDCERADGRRPLELARDNEYCISVATNDVGGNDRAVLMKPDIGGWNYHTAMTIALPREKGTLYFNYKTSIAQPNYGDAMLTISVRGREKVRWVTTVDSWSEYSESINAEEQPTVVEWYFYAEDESDCVLIDNIRWIPDGAGPSYAADDTPVTGFSMADGQLGFSFAADGSSTYHILGTNDVAAPWPWPFVREIKADETQPVRIGIKADEPKMFYRIRALIP